MIRIAVIGCGAAGAFCGALLRQALPGACITLFEASSRPMAKLSVTGGGRCNFTNSFEGISSLQQAYPRGANLLRRGLKEFGWKDACRWFEDRGVRFVIQEDHCVFPASQDAMQIVGTLLDSLDGTYVRTSCRVGKVLKEKTIVLEDGSRESFDRVVITTGGSPRHNTLLEDLGIDFIEPVPSLFTFTIDSPVTELAGIVANVSVRLTGTSFRASGPLLITDWGMSGPAVLKLSSYASRHLAEKGYKASLGVNWLDTDSESARSSILQSIEANPRKQLSSVHPAAIPSRLWEFLLDKCGLRADIRCAELGRTGLNRLAETLVNDEYMISGKSPFKEEFVTCGGVSLKSVNPATLECRDHPGIHFAGEILDIDAITGGFNLQAAWTTAWLAARAIIKTLS